MMVQPRLNGLVLHNDEIYARHMREEYTAQGLYKNSVVVEINTNTATSGQLKLPGLAQDAEGEELNIHYLTAEEKIAEAEAEYNRTHYSMEESFLRDLYSGIMESVLSNFDDKTDVFKATEAFSMNAARYGQLINHFFADDVNIDAHKAKLSEVIESAKTNISQKAAESLAGFFEQNNTSFDKAAMTDTISELLTQRTAQYAQSYQNGELSVENTDKSVYQYMNAKDDVASAANAQFGEISYNDVARLSDAIYEFESAIISQIDNIRYGGAITKEQVGMVLGLASAQVHIMDDGSSLFAAFSKAANNSISNTLDQLVRESEKNAREFNSEGYGLTMKAFSRSSVLEIMSWFNGVENGDTEKNLLLAMQKVTNSYNSAANDDSLYAGAFSAKNKHLSFMPSDFWADMQQWSSAERNDAVNYMTGYMLLNWNIWSKSSTVIQNNSNYIVGSTGSLVNESV